MCCNGSFFLTKASFLGFSLSYIILLAMKFNMGLLIDEMDFSR